MMMMMNVCVLPELWLCHQDYKVDAHCHTHFANQSVHTDPFIWSSTCHSSGIKDYKEALKS